MAQAVTWENRIVGVGEEPADQLLANPRNFRIHSMFQQDVVKGSLDELGWIKRVTVNQRTGFVVDGHLRVKLAGRYGQIVPVEYVDLSDAEEALALTMIDPTAALAGTDAALLEDTLRDVSAGDAAVQQFLAELAEREGVIDGLTTETEPINPYTAKVNTPLYTPTGEQPAISDLTDTSRYDALSGVIHASALPDDVKTFLLMAATRHIVFDYRNIAEFYAHADAETQRLMEDSALVIIDFNRAIELGYVNLSSRLDGILQETLADG